MKVLWQYSKGYRLKAFLGPLFKLIEACMELMLPIFMSTLVNNLYDLPTYFVGRQLALSNTLCITIMACTIVLGYILAILCQYFASVASMGFGGKLRQAVFSHIEGLSHAETERFGAESLVTRVTNDVNQLQHGIAMLIRLVTRMPVLAIGASVMVALVSPSMAIVFAVVVPIVLAILIFFTVKIIPLYRAVQLRLDRIAALTDENLQGARVIRAFNQEAAEEERAEKAAAEYYSCSMRVNKYASLMTPLSAMLMNVAIGVMVLLGAKLVNNGALAAGEISAFVTYGLWIVLSLTVVANLSPVITRAIASGGRIAEVLNTKTSIVDTGTRTQSEYPTQNIIEFDNVSFGYNEAKPVITNVSLSIKRGEKVGVIGVTGSGKSTLCKLLPRLYDVTDGSLYVDGIEVKEQPLDSLRAHFAVVPQRTVLFKGTIRSNVAFGRMVSDEDIRQALVNAEASEFVDKLKDGLDSTVAKNGRNLSGGQRQRLAIARALVEARDILILDDSTSALDFVTERSLRKRLFSLPSTVIVISQRVSSVMSADKIVVLDEGRIVGIGTHDELLLSNEVYKDICNSQQTEEKR